MIKSKGATDEYRNGWERIWVRRREFKFTHEILENLAKLPQPPDDTYGEEEEEEEIEYRRHRAARRRVRE